MMGPHAMELLISPGTSLWSITPLPSTSPPICVARLLGTQTCSDLARREACWAPGCCGGSSCSPVAPLLPGELSHHISHPFGLLAAASVPSIPAGDIQGFASCVLRTRPPGYPAWGLVPPISRDGRVQMAVLGAAAPALAQTCLVLILSDAEVPALVPIDRTRSAFSVNRAVFMSQWLWVHELLLLSLLTDSFCLFAGPRRSRMCWTLWQSQGSHGHAVSSAMIPR